MEYNMFIFYKVKDLLHSNYCIEVVTFNIFRGDNMLKYRSILKKTISIVLCVLMLFSLVPQLTLNVHAGTYEDKFDTYSEVPITTGTASAEFPYVVYEGASAGDWSYDSVQEVLVGPKFVSGQTNPTVLIDEMLGEISGETTVSSDITYSTDDLSQYVGVVARYTKNSNGENCYYRAYLKRTKLPEERATLYVEQRINNKTSSALKSIEINNPSTSPTPIIKPIKIGVTYNLKMHIVDIEGGSVKIEVFLDGDKVLETTDDAAIALKSGKVGLYSNNSKITSTYKYDNFKVDAASIGAPTGIAAPTNLTATLTDHQASLTWDEVTDAVSYDVYRKTGVGSYTPIKIGAPPPPYTDIALEDGNTYTYVVRAVDAAAKQSANSNAALVTLKPAAPTGLSATGGDQKVDLTWSPVTGATSYNIYRSLTTGGPYGTAIVSPTASYTDSTVTNGTKYYYVVYAVNSAGESATSSEVSATPVAPETAPLAPTGLTATVLDDTITLGWDATAHASTYTVKRSTASAGPYTDVSTNIAGTSCIDSGLSLGTYYYVVSAVNSAGVSPDSTPISKEIVLPTAPTLLDPTTPSSGKVSLTWSYSGAAKSYNVYMSSDGGSTYTKVNTSDIAAKAYIVSGLTNDTTYYFVVTIVNDVGESLYSTPKSATPKEVPAVVINVTPGKLQSALSSAPNGATLILADGIYNESFSFSGKSDITITEDKNDNNDTKPIFNAASGSEVKLSSNIIFDGIDFSIRIEGADWFKITNCNNLQVINSHFYSPSTITNAKSTTWIIIQGVNSKDNRIANNIFENKIDNGKFINVDGGLYSIEPRTPSQNDVIEYNQFKNTVSRQDNESEPIRLGVSDLVTFDAHTVVQYNTFYHADSDPEIISVKSSSDIIRYNTFIECLGTVCIRQAFNTEVYGNYFLGNNRMVDGNGTGGVRIYSNGHKVYNNYFEGLTGTLWDAAITMTDGDSVNPELHMGESLSTHFPAKNVIIANNTFVNNEHNFEIGFKNVNGKNVLSKPITNVTIANNLVVGSKNELVKIMDQPVNLTLTGNIMFTQGEATFVTCDSAAQYAYWNTLTPAQIKQVDPMLYKSGDYYKLSPTSPAIDAAIGDYSVTGALGFISQDMDHEIRIPGTVDIGADEYYASGSADNTPPTWENASPLSITADGTTFKTIAINWTAAKDDHGISGYKIYKDESLLATVLSSATSYTATGLQPETSYSFKVIALDLVGNTSADSNIVSTTTLKLPPLTITSLSISGLRPMLLEDSPIQAVVTAKYSDDTTKDVTASAVFSSSNPQVATISDTGLVSVVAAGTTTITVSYNDSSSTTYELTVQSATKTDLVASQDAYVQLSTISDNTYMWIKNNADTEFRDGFIQFDLSKLNGIAAKSTLKLGVSALDSNTTSCDFKIFGLDDDNWSESTITYANQPTAQGTLLGSGTVVAGNVGNYIEFDVSNFVSTQTDGKVSFRIRGVTRSKGFKLASKENVPVAPLLPIPPVLSVSTIQDVQATGVQLDKTSAEMKVNETLMINATVTPSNASNKTVTWSVYDSANNVVTITSLGSVTAIGEGTAKIRASVSDSVYADCTIVVKGTIAVIPVTGISISPKTNVLKVGESFTVTANVTPKDATNKIVAWISDTPTIVTVNNEGVVKAIGVGSATIRATVVGTVYYADCDITVLVTPKNAHSHFFPTPITNVPTGKVVTVNELNGALEKANADSNGIKAVQFEVAKVDGAKAYEFSLPSTAISQDSMSQTIEIKTPLGTAVLPGNMFNSTQTSNMQNISLSMELIDKSNINETDVREKIGDRPIINISIKSDGKIVEYNNPNVPVTISVPYTPTADELQNYEKIIVYYLDGSGKAVKVPNAKYNVETGMVTFKTTHFSRYAISYDNKTFADLGSYSWAKKEIEVLATKGIINGTNDTSFSPAENITRADFILLLVRTLGITADFSDNFNDVKSGDYFYQALGIAKKLGITQGSGNNLFKPSEDISRQDMMVLCARALKASEIIKTNGSASDIAKFSDKSNVAEYAKEDIASMVKEGIVTGDGSILNPLGNATRAETAVIMYRIFNKQ